MPYIVTTTRAYVPDPSRGDAPAHAYAPIVLSDVAVATLDEAREDVELIAGDYLPSLSEAKWEGWCAQFNAIPADGGSVSLPQGITIEVKQSDWQSLMESCDYDGTFSDGSIIDAYNAAQVPA